MYVLHIANKNYSSWSLRPWVLLKELDIPFHEVLHPFGVKDDWDDYKKINPVALVPCLVDENLSVWDSLAIIEFLAEKHTDVWPIDSIARAWSRCVSAEMHSGFSELRTMCSMSCGVRIQLNIMTPNLRKDISRIEEIWQEGLSRFGGPFLAGSRFSAVDAFYAPIAFRFQTYQIKLSEEASAYMQRLLRVPSMMLWYEQALNETYRDEPHELMVASFGAPTYDYRKA